MAFENFKGLVKYEGAYSGFQKTEGTLAFGKISSGYTREGSTVAVNYPLYVVWAYNMEMVMPDAEAFYSLMSQVANHETRIAALEAAKANFKVTDGDTIDLTYANGDLTAEVILSANDNNVLTKGTDKGLYVNGAAFEAAFEDGSATIATVADDVVTIKAGVAQTNGAVAQGTGADITLAKVAKTGTAADVTIVDAADQITATDVEGALSELATKISDNKVSIVKMTEAEEGFLATYELHDASGNKLGDSINLAKDLVVTGGEVITVDQDHPVEGLENGTYLKLTIANQTAPVYINVQDLLDDTNIVTSVDEATGELLIEIVNTTGDVKIASTSKLQSAVTKIEGLTVSATDGVTLDGVTYKYTHPTFTAADAAAVKVGRDAEGHVVLGDALTAIDIAYTNTDLGEGVTTVAGGLDELTDRVEGLEAAGVKTITAEPEVDPEEDETDNFIRIAVSADKDSGEVTLSSSAALKTTNSTTTATALATDGYVKDEVAAGETRVTTALKGDVSENGDTLGKLEDRIEELEKLDDVATTLTLTAETGNIVKLQDKAAADSNDHDYELTITTATEHTMPANVTTPQAAATGLATDKFVKDEVAIALAWNVIA